MRLLHNRARIPGPGRRLGIPSVVRCLTRLAGVSVAGVSVTGVTVAALSIAPTAAVAQVPGYQQLDTRQIIAEYHAEVIAQLNALMADWGRAWAADDLESLGALYTDNAVLLPPGGEPLRGREALLGYLASILPRLGRAEAFMLDFDASGGMATIYGNYLIELQTGGQAGRTATGSLVTVYKQQGRKWRIRAQVFVGPPPLQAPPGY